jgi:hypothetical protein
MILQALNLKAPLCRIVSDFSSFTVEPKSPFAAEFRMFFQASKPKRAVLGAELREIINALKSNVPFCWRILSDSLSFKTQSSLLLLDF